MSPALLADLQPTLGAWFIGAIASVGLLGVLSLQCWTYFLRFPSDPGVLKVLVLTVWALVFAKCVTSIHAGYFLAVVKWGNVVALLKPLWTMKAMVLLSNVTIFLVHLFFVHKVWMLTRKRYWWISTIIMVFSVAHFGLGLAAFITAWLGTSYEAIVFGQAGRFATAGLVCAIVADWTITTSLVIFLRAEKGSQLDIGLTKKFLSVLIFYTINIGLLVSLVDLVVLILMHVNFKFLNLYQLMCYQIVGNLYANTLIACLNMRSAPSSLELSELSKPRHYPSASSNSIVVNKQRITSSRPSSTRGGYGPNNSVLEVDIGKDGGLGTYPLVTGHTPSRESIQIPPGWGRERVLKSPDVVITRTTVTTVM